MKIAMFTNTYLPHVGGVARSVESTVCTLKAKGHQCLIIAPEFEGVTGDETGVVRVKALQNFNGSDFSVKLPLLDNIDDAINDFDPDIVHSHHPFLLGDSALRAARLANVPIVFTHHTLYEQYTHYVPLDSDVMKRLSVAISTEYANLCDGVIAPSQSIAELIQSRGVSRPIREVPTGISPEQFSKGNGKHFRRRFGVSDESFLIGHVGRLAEEKNLTYLCGAIAHYLKSDLNAKFLVVGDGDLKDWIADYFAKRELTRQLVMAGCQTGQDLADAYRAMDVFVFSSQSETQGMVLSEAMAAGNPVIALDASGAREVVRDGKNGILLPVDTTEEGFAKSIDRLLDSMFRDEAFQVEARSTAESFSLDNCANRLLQFYQETIQQFEEEKESPDSDGWEGVLTSIKTEWELLTGKTSAAIAAISHSNEDVKLKL